MKKGGDFALELVRTKDILAELGARKERQVLVVLRRNPRSWSGMPWISCGGKPRSDCRQRYFPAGYRLCQRRKLPASVFCRWAERAD